LRIQSGLEVKLCDIPEMKYTWKDVDENGKPAPRGEIWLRGPMVFKGYYKLPDITREAVNEEGWLKTGDVAQFFPETMSFKLIDRRKNIFKLQQGEYLAPDRI
jgi:long-chain acyl-CoA synthetase